MLKKLLTAVNGLKVTVENQRSQLEEQRSQLEKQEAVNQDLCRQLSQEKADRMRDIALLTRVFYPVHPFYCVAHRNCRLLFQLRHSIFEPFLISHERKSSVT